MEPSRRLQRTLCTDYTLPRHHPIFCSFHLRRSERTPTFSKLQARHRIHRESLERWRYCTRAQIAVGLLHPSDQYRRRRLYSTQLLNLAWHAQDDSFRCALCDPGFHGTMASGTPHLLKPNWRLTSVHGVSELIPEKNYELRECLAMTASNRLF